MLRAITIHSKWACLNLHKELYFRHFIVIASSIFLLSSVSVTIVEIYLLGAQRFCRKYFHKDRQQRFVVFYIYDVALILAEPFLKKTTIFSINSSAICC